MKKIIIIGCPSSGKTTMANKLGSILHIPVHHLDKLFWAQEGGIKQEIFIAKQEELMKNESWIIDGHFWKSKSFDLRLQKADAILFFDFPKRLIYWRLLKRTLKNYGKVRPDMPVGNKDSFDWKLIKYIWNHSEKPIYEKVIPYKNNKEVFIIKNKRDERALLKKVTNF